MYKSFILSLITILVLTSTYGQTQKKFGLVIGIKDYVYVQPLKNSLNDAMDMSATLKRNGFEVIELYNPKTKRDIQDAIKKYYTLLSENKDAAGLVFYSGHGMQVDGINYLMPANSNPEIKADLDDQAVKMEYMLAAVEQAGNPLNIFILDACRNNPFRSFSRSAEVGLNQISAPKGSFVVYATAPGSVASDGTGRNGLFTSKLLKYISSPNIVIEQVFKYVSRDVQQESNGSQIPWINYSYYGDFSFNGTVNNNVPGTISQEPSIAPKLSIEESREMGKRLVEAQRFKDAYVYLKDAAEQGDAEGQNFFSELYQYGLGVEKNVKEAAVWLKKAAEQGNVLAQYKFGVLLIGITAQPEIEKNEPEGRMWIRKAADQGYTAAYSTLASMYSSGLWGTPKDYTEALNWYTKLFEANSDNVMLKPITKMAPSMIALIYSTGGYGVSLNYSEALKWYKKSAESLDETGAGSSWRIGDMYHNGQGVAVDDVEALKWYLKGAEFGNKIYKHFVGQFYDTGKYYGVGKKVFPVNREEAISWYKKAASQGEEQSRKRLKELGVEF